MFNLFPDHLQVHIFSYLGPVWNRIGQRISAHCHRLLTGVEYARLCLFGQVNVDRQRLIRQAIFIHPIPMTLAACIREKVLPASRLDVGVVAFSDGHCMRTVQLGNYFVCMGAQRLFVIDPVGRLCGPFDIYDADGDFTFLNSDRGAPEGPYLGYTQGLRFYLVRPEAFFTVTPPCLPPPLYFIDLPLPDIRDDACYSNHRLLYYREFTQTFSAYQIVYDGTPRRACTTRLVWERSYPQADLGRFPSFQLSGDMVVLYSSRRRWRQSVVVLRAEDGAVLWHRRTLPRAVPEFLNWNFTTSGYLMGISVPLEQSCGRVHCIDPRTGLYIGAARVAVEQYDEGPYNLAPGDLMVVHCRDENDRVSSMVFDHPRNERLQFCSQSDRAPFRAFVLYRKLADGPIFHYVLDESDSMHAERRRADEAAGRLDHQCVHCGEAGHWDNECPEQFDVEPLSQYANDCFRCGRSGHHKTDCYAMYHIGGRRLS